MTSMLHTLASTFTTCACGAKARDCVLARIAEFVENQTPLTPSPSPPSQFTKEKHGPKGRGKSEQAEESPIDLGPLIGIERGFRTRERIPFSGGMGGVELVSPSPTEAGPSRLATGTRKVSFPDDLLNATPKAKKGKDRKGKGRADEDDSDGGNDHRGTRVHRSLPPSCADHTFKLVPALGATPKLPSRLWRSTTLCQSHVYRPSCAKPGLRRALSDCVTAEVTPTLTWTHSRLMVADGRESEALRMSLASVRGPPYAPGYHLF